MSEFVAGNCNDLLRAAPNIFPRSKGVRRRGAEILETLFSKTMRRGRHRRGARAGGGAASLSTDDRRLRLQGSGRRFLLALHEAACACSSTARRFPVDAAARAVAPAAPEDRRHRRARSFRAASNIIDDMHTPKHVPPRFDYAVRIEGPLLVPIQRQSSTCGRWSCGPVRRRARSLRSRCRRHRAGPAARLRNSRQHAAPR